MVSYTRMSGELVTFEALDKVQLEGLLCAPQKTKTCVVHVHGMTDNFVGLSVVDSLVRAANANGMAFFTMNTRGMGTITVFTRLKEHLSYRTVGTSFENFKDCILDIHAAIVALKQRGYRNFILSGHSTGCQKIAYYQFRKQSKAVKGLILLGPADDLNFQIKKLGRRKYRETIEFAKKLVRQGRGKELMPVEYEPSYFSAKRYYELYNPKSVEGNLFNYEGKLRAISKIACPVLSVFGSKEEYAAMSARGMLKILGSKFLHPYAKEVLVPDADHCFCMQEDVVEEVVVRWLKHLAYE